MRAWLIGLIALLSPPAVCWSVIVGHLSPSCKGVYWTRPEAFRTGPPSCPVQGMRTYHHALKQNIQEPLHTHNRSWARWQLRILSPTTKLHILIFFAQAHPAFHILDPVLKWISAVYYKCIQQLYIRVIIVACDKSSYRVDNEARFWSDITLTYRHTGRSIHIFINVTDVGAVWVCKTYIYENGILVIKMNYSISRMNSKCQL